MAQIDRKSALAPKTARRVKDDREEEVPIAAIQVGDVLRVGPGERVPVDGILLEGRSEKFPRNKSRRRLCNCEGPVRK